MPAFLDLSAYADLSIPTPDVPPPPSPSLLTEAFVDSMATFWIVDSVDKLYTVTSRNPGVSINTANGMAPVSAIGTALAYLRVGSKWECYEVPNVYVLEG